MASEPTKDLRRPSMETRPTSFDIRAWLIRTTPTVATDGRRANEKLVHSSQIGSGAADLVGRERKMDALIWFIYLSLLSRLYEFALKAVAISIGQLSATGRIISKDDFICSAQSR